MTKQEALFNYTLRLGDSSLILSHRLAEWTSRGPFLEEDLALTNIALDILGQAKALLDYAAKVEDKGRNADDLAYFRNEREFYNLLITEQDNGDYAKTITRQFFTDHYHLLLFQALSNSKDQTLAAIAQKSLKEIAYHVRHSSSWMERFGNGTEESQQRAQRAVDNLWRFTGEFFEMNEVDEMLIADGIAVDLKALQPLWESKVRQHLVVCNLQIPDNTFMQSGSRRACHTEQLGYILAEMQHLPRMHPTAKW